MSLSKDPCFLLTRVLLDFEEEREEIISDISAAAFSDDGSLWVGSDEMIGVERAFTGWLSQLWRTPAFPTQKLH